MVQTSFTTKASPEEAFRFIASGDAMELFRGSFLIPGIRETRIKGRNIFVTDSWGLEHEERVVQARRANLLVFRIKPNRLLRLLLASLLEEWRIEETPSGSQITRTFSLAPRKWSGPLLPFIEKRLRRAIRSNNETLTFHLLLKRKQISKPLSL